MSDPRLTAKWEASDAAMRDEIATLKAEVERLTARVSAAWSEGYQVGAVSAGLAARAALAADKETT